MSKDYLIQSKLTNQIKEEEWVQIVNSFNKVFKKKFKTSYFKNKYLSSSLNFSFHAFLIFKKKIVGMYSVIPWKYNFLDEVVIIGQSCDAFVDPNHRKNPFFLKKMSVSLHEQLLDHKVHRLISLPNENAYKYWKLIAGWRDIGELDYYLLPLNLNYFKKLNFLNSLYRILLLIYFKFSFFLNYRFSESKIKLIKLLKNTSFIEKRFLNYKKLTVTNSFIKFYNEDNLKVGYLFNFFGDSENKLLKKIKFFFKNQSIDILISVGKISNNYPLIKVPKSFIARRQKMIGYSLIGDDAIFFNLDNWEVDLTNFDNR